MGRTRTSHVRALPHAEFLDRGDPATSHARVGHAAFVVLRLVDLLVPDRRPTVGADEFRLQDRAVEQFVQELETADDAAGEVTWLRQIHRAAAPAFETRGPRELDELSQSLDGYSINRKDHERHDEAIDLLETAWLILRRSPGNVSAAWQLGRYLTWAGRVEAAAALYRRLGREAARDAPLIARLGAADVRLADGDPRGAERRYRRLLPDARRVGSDVAVRQAEEGLVRALLAQGRAAEAAVRAWQLHEQSPGFGLPEVGAALEGAGALNAAAAAHAVNALGHPQPTRRWQAVASLVRIAVRQGDRLAFERWRRVGERYHEEGTPSPSYEIDFWLEEARGAARFGGREAARGSLATARALAARAAAEDTVFRVRAAEVDVEQGRYPEPPPGAPPDDPEFRRVLDAVRAFGVPSGWATSVT